VPNSRQAKLVSKTWHYTKELGPEKDDLKRDIEHFKKITLSIVGIKKTSLWPRMLFLFLPA
jgi:hypothetical protein